MDIQSLIASYTPHPDVVDLLRGVRTVVFCGITGAGKDTIEDVLFQDDRFERIITSTTRLPRDNNGVMERDGNEYYFFTQEQALEKLQNQEYFEVAYVHEMIYGVTVDEIRRIRDAGKVAVTDVDYQGVDYYHQYNPDTIAIFLIPPSFEVWMERLKKRYDTEQDFQEAWPARARSAIRELEWVLSSGYVRVVVNDVIEDTVRISREIIDGSTVSTGGRNQARAILERVQSELTD